MMKHKLINLEIILIKNTMGIEQSGNSNELIKQRFDKEHQNLDKLLLKYHIDKQIDKIKFKKLFYPLIHDSVLLDFLFDYFETEKAKRKQKVPKAMLRNFYSIFFYSNSNECSLTLKNLFNEMSKNSKIKNLMFHPQDSSIYNSIIINNFPFKEHVLALEEMKELKDICNREHCRIVKCDCAKQNEKLNNEEEFRKNTYGNFKKIELKNNSKFPISILQKMFNQYNNSSPELNNILIEYIKRLTLSNYIDFTRFQYFFFELITNFQKKKTIKLIKRYCFFETSDEKHKKNANIFNDGKQNDNNLNDYLSVNVLTAINNLSYIPVIEFESYIFDNEILQTHINRLFKGKTLDQYQEEIFKKKDVFYVEGKQNFESIINRIQNNRIYIDEGCTSSKNPLTEEGIPRLKKGINLKDIMLIDETLFNIMKMHGVPFEKNDWCEYYLKLFKIKYEKDPNDELPKGTMFEEKGNMIYELELFPICVIVYSFEEEYVKRINLSKENFFSKDFDLLVSQIKINLNNFKLFSRKTKLKEVIQEMEKSYKEIFPELKPTDYYIYMAGKTLTKIEKPEMTLEQMQISDKIFLLLDSLNPHSKTKNIPQYKVTYYQTMFENLNEIAQQFAKEIKETTKPIEEVKELNIDYSSLPLKFSMRGNLCFFNSVMQLFLNLLLLKEYLFPLGETFINKYLSFFNKGFLGKSLIKILKLRWSNDIEQKNKLHNLGDLRELFSSNIKQFSSFSQQDANEFLSISLDELNEEFNLKTKKKKFLNYQPGSNKQESFIKRADSIRNCPSLINAMFSFNLKSELKCQECKNKKTNYEYNTSLFLAIPASKYIQFKLYIFKLPFWLKLYYNQINDSFSHFVNNNSTNSLLWNLNTYLYNNIIEENEIDLKAGIRPIYSEYTFDRTKKICDLIKEIRKIPELELEPDNKLTSLLVYGVSEEDNLNEKDPIYFDDYLIVDQCIQNNQVVYIYEVLNLKGLQELNDIILKKFTKPQMERPNKDTNMFDNKEHKIIIKHFTIKSNEDYYLRKYQRESLPIKQEYIIFQNNYIYGYTLYELIWLKYRKYFLTLNKETFWWNNIELKNPQHKSLCYPFTIKIMEKTKTQDVLNCPFCGWWRFCTGCTINPTTLVNVPNIENSIIVIDWCSSVWYSKIIREQIKNVIHYNINNVVLNTEPELTLNECLKKHIEEECLEDKLKCSNCDKCTTFTKQYLFDLIMPPIIIITLNRFKYTKIYMNKISTFIDYPLNDLKISNDYYDLYGVINHFGTLNEGHYSAIIKIHMNHNDEWINFTDTNYEIIPHEKVVNKYAYILVYINKNAKDNNYINMIYDLMIQIKNNENNIIEKYNVRNIDEIKEETIYPSQFYKGEPIIYKNNQGCYLEKVNETQCIIITSDGEETVESNEIEHDLFYTFNKDNVKMLINNRYTFLKDDNKGNCLVY